MPLILLLAALFIAAPVFAQPVIVAGPKVDDVTPGGARVTWATNISAAPRLRCSATPGGPYHWVSQRNETSIIQGLWLAGWAPASTAYCRACSASGGETCSSEFTITTAPAPAESPQKPLPPVELDVSMPDGAYGEPFRVDAACSNLQTVLDSLSSLTGALNYEVRIPPQSTGAVCRGQFALPPRPNHHGWIVIRPDVEDAKLPPEGSRITPEFRPSMAKIVTNALGLHPSTSTGWTEGLTLGTSCSAGEFSWFRHHGQYPLLQCTGNSGWEATKNVVSQNNASPLELTVPAHGYQTGDVVQIASSAGATIRPAEGPSVAGNYANGQWIIEVVNADRIRLISSNYVSGTVNTVRRNAAWRQRSYTAGTVIPGSCTPGEWFVKTDNPWGQRHFWCLEPNVYRQMAMRDPITDNHRTSAIYTDMLVKPSKYRLIGLEITHEPHVYQTGWNQQNHQQGGLVQLVHFGLGSRDIILDRCDIHGHDYPSRVTYGIISYADRFALINSRVDGISRWLMRPAAGGANLESFAAYIRAGAVGRIENNYLRSLGITLFFSDTGNSYSSPWTSSTLATDPPSDWVIRRNFFDHPDSFRRGSPASDGRDYFNRHHLEWKRGVRMLVEGNIFDRNWADVVHGASLLITPTSGSNGTTAINSASGATLTLATSASRLKPGDLIYVDGSSVAAYNGIWEVQQVGSGTHELWDNVTAITLLGGPSGSSCVSSCGNIRMAAGRSQVADIDVRYNTIRNTPRSLELIGRHNWSAGQAPTRRTQRIRLLGNLIYDLDARSFSVGGYVSASAPIGAGGRRNFLLSAVYNVEDLRVEENTVIDLYGVEQHALFHDFSDDSAGTNGGLLMARNLWLSASPNGNNLFTNTVTSGSSFLDQRWTRYPGRGWEVRDNVFCCGLSSVGEPEGNFWPAAAAGIGLQRYNSDDFGTKLYRNIRYSLRPDSPYNGGGEGQPRDRVGVSLERLESAQGLVRNVRVRAVTPTSATISYLAPDEAPCHVEVSTSAAWGSGTRRPDGGGNRARNVTFSGLATGVPHHFRVYCATPLPETGRHANGVFEPR
jgi:hypothetical protein